MAALENVIAEVIADLRSVPGLAAAPNHPQEQINEWPMLFAFSKSGSWRLGTADDGIGHKMRFGSHTIQVVVMVPRKDLPADIARLMPFAESVPNALLAGFVRDKFGGSIVGLGDVWGGSGSTAITYETGGDDYTQGVELIRFSMTVSVEEVINV